MIAVLAISMLIAGGLLAAWFSARFGGMRRAAALSLLLLGPFVILAVALASANDPTLTAAQASNNYWLAFGLITTVMAVPWSLAILIGALIGARRAKRPAAVTPVKSPPPSTLPRQWAPGDVTLLNAEALNREIAALAERVGLDLAQVPHVGLAAGDGSAHVEIDHEERAYHLIVAERGHELSRRSTDIVERLLYWIADDVTHGMATASPLSDVERTMEYPAAVRARRSALMLRVAPQWHGGWLADPDATGHGHVANEPRR